MEYRSVRVTAELLRRLGLCRGSADRFAMLFKKGLILNKPNLMRAYALHLHVDTFMVEVLTPTGYKLWESMCETRDGCLGDGDSCNPCSSTDFMQLLKEGHGSARFYRLADKVNTK